MAQSAAGKRGIIYALIGVGFAGLIGAHEFAGADDNADLTVPFILAAVGTLSFISAGIMAFRLLRDGGAPR
jgi:tellurite resistance protein TehA-like permease